MLADTLLKKHPVISEQVTREQLAVVLRELEKILSDGTTGAVVEFGCYIGTTSLFIRRMLDVLDPAGKHPFHVYDSFAGLPAKAAADSSAAGTDFKAGELSVSKKQFLMQFQRAHLRPPITHKAWFADLTPDDIPKPIAFAFLDGDFYDSILTSLQLVWPHLSPSAVIAIDDYQREALPGVERAVKQFLSNKSYKRLYAEHNVAVIQTARIGS